jgi:hypothetical protein
MNKILMAIPTEGGVHERTSALAARLSARPGVEYVTAKGRPVDYVRNSIVREFREQIHLTHLFFLDSDVEPPLDVLDRLLKLDAPLAGGCYPLLMANGLRWALSRRDDQGSYQLLEELPDKSEPFEVDAGGAGCLLIRRDIFEFTDWPWFKWIERPDGSQMSEDIYFFQKANKAGFVLKVDPKIICHHFKTINLTSLMVARMKNRKD